VLLVGFCVVPVVIIYRRILKPVPVKPLECEGREKHEGAVRWMEVYYIDGQANPVAYQEAIRGAFCEKCRETLVRHLAEDIHDYNYEHNGMHSGYAVAKAVRVNLLAMLMLLSTLPAWGRSPEQDALRIMGELAAYKYEMADIKDRGSYEAIAHAVRAQKRGLCGSKTITMVHEMQELGHTARYVGLFGLSMFGTECYASHAMCEVYYDGSWHLFGTTWGVYFKDGSRILSLSEMLANPNRGVGYGDPEIIKMKRRIFKEHLVVVYGEEERQQLQKLLR
jgi:hypothetical protein